MQHCCISNMCTAQSSTWARSLSLEASFLLRVLIELRDGRFIEEPYPATAVNPQVRPVLQRFRQACALNMPPAKTAAASRMTPHPGLEAPIRSKMQLSELQGKTKKPPAGQGAQNSKCRERLVRSLKVGWVLCRQGSFKAIQQDIKYHLQMPFLVLARKGDVAPRRFV